MPLHSTDREVLERASDLRQSHAGLRTEVAARIAISFAYNNGRHWNRVERDRLGSISQFPVEEDWDPQSSEIRVVDNKIGPRVREVVARSHPERIEAEVRLPQHMRSFHDQELANVSQNVLNGLDHSAAFTKTAQEASHHRWIAGSSLLIVELSQKRQRIDADIATDPDGEPIEMNDQWVRWEMSPLTDLVWDPANLCPDLDKHTVMMLERVFTVRRFEQVYGPLEQFDIDRDRLPQVKDVAPHFTAASQVAGTNFFSRFVSDSREKALVVTILLESDPRDPNGWPEQYMILDTSPFGSVRNDVSGRVVNIDRPRTPFGWHGRNIFKLDGFWTGDSVWSWGVPSVLMPYNDLVNILQSTSTQQLLHAVHGHWLIDSRTTSKETFVGELGGGVGGVLTFKSAPDRNSVPPQWIKSDAVNTEFVTLVAQHGLNMDAAVHTSQLQRGVGKCIDGDSMIMDPMNGSMRTIREIVSDEVPSLVHSIDNGKMSIACASHKVDTGLNECLKITLASGRSIVTTYEHPFLLSHGWTRADDLHVGETVATPRRIPEPEYHLTIGRDVDLIAILCAEGGMTVEWRFSTADDRIVQYATEASNHHGCRVVRLLKSGPYDYAIRGNGKGRPHPLRSAMKKWGMPFAKSKNKRIPPIIFRLGSVELARFLSVFVMCDGWITKDGVPNITLASEHMVRDIQHLFLRLGIQSRVRRKAGKPAWNLAVYAASKDECISRLKLWGRKAERLDLWKSRKPNGNVGTSVSVRPGFKRVLRGLIKYGNGPAVSAALNWKRNRFSKYSLFNSCTGGNGGRMSLSQFSAMCRVFGNEDYQHLLQTSDIWWDEVVSITALGKRHTYDLTVPKHHSFVANDIIVHNTHVPQEVTFALLHESGRVADTINKRDADLYSDALKLTLGTTRRVFDGPNRMMARLRDEHGFSVADLETFHRLDARKVVLNVRVRESSIISRSIDERTAQLDAALTIGEISRAEHTLAMADELQRPITRGHELQVRSIRASIANIMNGMPWPGIPSIDTEMFILLARQAIAGVDMREPGSLQRIAFLELAADTQRRIGLQQAGEVAAIGGQAGGNGRNGQQSRLGGGSLVPPLQGAPESINPLTNPSGAAGGLPLGLPAASA